MLRIDKIYKMILLYAWQRLFPLKLAGVRIGQGSEIKSSCTLGYGTRIGKRLYIKGAGNAEFGKYCAVGEDVKIITSNHDVSYMCMQYTLQEHILGKRLTAEKTDVAIGNGVWIGDNSIILAGVTVGDGAVIGAGSVVTGSVAAYTVVAGNPAKVIKNRFSQELSNFVQSVDWWNWDEKKMRINRFIFELNLKDADLQDLPKIQK